EPGSGADRPAFGHRLRLHCRLERRQPAFLVGLVRGQAVRSPGTRPDLSIGRRQRTLRPRRRGRRARSLHTHGSGLARVRAARASAGAHATSVGRGRSRRGPRPAPAVRGPCPRHRRPRRSPDGGTRGAVVRCDRPLLPTGREGPQDRDSRQESRSDEGGPAPPRPQPARDRLRCRRRPPPGHAQRTRKNPDRRRRGRPHECRDRHGPAPVDADGRMAPRAHLPSPARGQPAGAERGGDGVARQVSSAPRGPRIFGRVAELELIHRSLRCSECSGILIEGEIGVGKTLLATQAFRDRGADEIWIRGDRVHQGVDCGAFGLLDDLDDDPATLLGRIVSMLTSTSTPQVVFVDDAHLLDSRSQRVLSELASAGSIRLAVLARSKTADGYIPFPTLVADRVLQHLALDVLPPKDSRPTIVHRLGGIVSQAAGDIVDFHSRRNRGYLLAPPGYRTRRGRFLKRRGVGILDGLDIDYDERARDYTRIGLLDYSTKEREVLELIVLAGEVDLATLLEAGLGEAADALVASGELRLDARGEHRYEAVENHAADTIRSTTPVGRSRAWFDF